MIFFILIQILRAQISVLKVKENAEMGNVNAEKDFNLMIAVRKLNAKMIDYKEEHVKKMENVHAIQDTKETNVVL